MNIDADDIDAVFRLRHDTKVAMGAAEALVALDALRERAGNTAALAFNRALCLLELGDNPGAHAAFRAAVADPQAPSKLGNFIIDGTELYLQTAPGSIPPDAEATILPVALYFNVDHRDRILSYLLHRDTDRATFHLFWAILEASRTAAFKSPPGAGIVRQLFNRCSSLDAEDLFNTALTDPRLAMCLGSDDLTLTKLLHGTELQPDVWLQTLNQMMSRTVLDSRDAIDLALIAMSTLDDDLSRPLIRALSEQSDQNWGVMRVLGILAEREGDLSGAMDLYDRAARAELKAHGSSPSPDFSTVNCRISGIALSYNDGPLVSHFCQMVVSHCDELVVNDGGSDDDTVLQFRRFSARTGFPIHVVEDDQHGNRERTIFARESYRNRKLGGVLGFQADRRRTTTLIQAKGDYILMLDLDDYLPPFPNLKTLVRASPYIEHFAGARLELIGNGRYTAAHLGDRQPRPTLFRRHPSHVYGGVGGGSEYLARLDFGIARWAMTEPHIFVTNTFTQWHLKHLLDKRLLFPVRPHLGPSFPIRNRWDRPLTSTLPPDVRI